MLSRQDRIKYGEELRQQIKQREEAKKVQRRENHSFSEDNPVSPQPTPKPSPQQAPPIDMARFKSKREEEKALLAKRMEEQEYNPFGRIGGGAPRKPTYSIEGRPRPPSGQRISEQPPYRQQVVEPVQAGEGEQRGRGASLERGGPPQHGPPHPEDKYRRIPTPQFLQGNYYKNTPFVSAHYAPPAPYGYVNVEEQKYDYQGRIEVAPQPRPADEPSLEQARKYPSENLPEFRPPSLPPPQQPQARPRPRAEEKQYEGREELEKEMFKQGGRNLLKFENTAPEEVNKKQQEKLRLQMELRRQMEEAQRKKKAEERRRREEDEALERKNKEFLEKEKLKFEEEERSKKGQARQVDEANAVQAEPLNPKKEKFKKIREEGARRREEERQEMMGRAEKENKAHRPVPPTPPLEKLNREVEEAGEMSSDSQVSKGFNTAISRDFFRKERQKSGAGREKFDIVAEQLTKMRQEMAQQNNMFHHKIEEYQQQALQAQRDKQQAERQVEKLKQQLESNNRKYLKDIYEGKLDKNDPYYADEVPVRQADQDVLRPRKSERLVLDEYRPDQFKKQKEHLPESLEGTMKNDSEMVSLIGDSKKIPLELNPTDTLSISKLENFAIDTDHFGRNNESPIHKRYHPQESIAEEDERREESRHSRRTKQPTRTSTRKTKPNFEEEELERLIHSRKKSRGGWGEMSSVNSDMVNQIEGMLKHKERPQSHLSRQGQQTLQQGSEVGSERESKGLNTLDRLIQKYM